MANNRRQHLQSSPYSIIVSVYSLRQTIHQVTSDYAQTHFNEILEHANQNSEGVIIVQESNHSILIPQDLLESFIETNQLLKYPNLLTDVQQAQEEYLKGDVITMEQIFG